MIYLALLLFPSVAWEIEKKLFVAKRWFTGFYFAVFVK